jgi:hypothetical protein
MLGRFEDLAAIGALALEDAGGVVQAMAQHMQLRVRPRQHLAVHPDEAVALVEGQRTSENSLGRRGPGDRSAKPTAARMPFVSRAGLDE